MRYPYFAIFSCIGIVASSLVVAPAATLAASPGSAKTLLKEGWKVVSVEYHKVSGAELVLQAGPSLVACHVDPPIDTCEWLVKND